MSSKTPSKNQKGNKNSKPGEKTDADLIQEQKEEIKKLKLRIETLERYMVLRSEQTQKARASEMEMKSKLSQLDEDFEKEKMERFHIASDMIRQYKALQKTLIEKLNTSEQKNTSLADQLHLAKVALHEVKKEKDQIIELKQREIEEQKQKMQSMVVEFSNMLKETLAKMGNTIQQERDLQDDAAYNLVNNSRLMDFIPPEMINSLKMGATNSNPPTLQQNTVVGNNAPSVTIPPSNNTLSTPQSKMSRRFD
ncbi:predicted protein [Naegleria gruberi]|uniref:Dynein regulatory complex protein 12 n=1 Tax=Naegleria gruberi TaxID=5762 RepID=D2UXV0_NAEGR|nr:uncharacterized protein NAEGRDRAFT_45024 [Naegleria gruberi]EFC50693.1 predicted protein [Naegleria gruberi]|eukprot:XP_002683437.1 predicted protein [Naegleria gruberi strain NEG-M]